MYKKLLLLFAAVLMVGVAAHAQDLAGNVAIGARGGITNYVGDGFDSAKQRFYGSIYGEHYLSDLFSLETAFNLGGLAGKTGAQDFSSYLAGVSLVGRMALLPGQDLRPYLVGGAEYMGIDPKGNSNLGFDRNAFAVPVGAGLSFLISENTSLDLRGLYHYTFKERLDGLNSGSKDSFISGTIGLTHLFSSNKDKDGDGLMNKDEKARGTDPKVADSDGDGLSDGDEVLTHKTDPLKADSDGDGLSDSDEVKKYSTNPNKADSDGDGLADGKEIMNHKTDPMKADTDNDRLSDNDELMASKTNPLLADTDGDGLKDGDEVNMYKTDALKADTDGDMLTDGEEASRYKTNPLKADTDDGTVNDEVEVKRGTNPLLADDDVPKKEVIQVEAGAAIVLEGVVFKSGSAVISPESEGTLIKAFNTLEAYPEIQIEIHGYTDNKGAQAVNMKLSQARADAVKAYMVKKGIAAERMVAKGFGSDKPIATNDTPEGRQTNRRIEFARIK